MAGLQVNLNITGVEELVKKLQTIEKKHARKAARTAIGEATKIVLKTAKALVPKDTGLLRKSLGRKVKVYRRNGVVTGLVGPRTNVTDRLKSRKGRGVVAKLNEIVGKALNAEVAKKPARYAHLVELGTMHSAAQPFLRPALDSNRDRLVGVIAAKLKAGI